MIIKKREVPLTIQKLQALQRRIPKHHPKQPIIREKLAKRLAGFKGESSIDYPLSFLPEKNYFILHDVRLYDSTHHFQMDSLLLSRQFILILEVKNYSGTLYFDQTFHQLIRTLDGKQEVFPDPLLQIQRQEQQLKKWLAMNRLPEVPIISLVVISNPYTLLQSSSEHKDLYQKVIRSEYLPTKINQIQEKFQEDQLSEKELKKVIRRIEKQHSSSNPDILEQFELSKDDLLKGVFCTTCNYLPVQRTYGTWNCPECSCEIKNAHLASIKDYELLIGLKFTNSDMREFLQITSPSLMTRILQSMDLSYAGTRKNRVYHFGNEEK
ncbi:nuclease-related domain-containing protein [Alkalihalobacillus sp. BA299]|uniref:nuclease-related domain-containing protein n=1 Tax=Alkalihalobacillus sp. BA299 TaxID=2815938 RepID=UPI001ADB05C3|nr:nuclease-related domain-containing protein [Alkalihalobacillus sp. BA299]